MKKLIALASLLSAFALSGFAQTVPARTPAEAGAKRVAERDAAWLKAHPGAAKAQTPAAHSGTKPARSSAKHAKSAKHTKKSSHSTPKAKAKAKAV
ncbi:MAG: hypothetical protein ACOYNZ_08300 [Rhodoferax sp.]